MNAEGLENSRSRSDDHDGDEVSKDLFTGERFPHGSIVRLLAGA